MRKTSLVSPRRTGFTLVELLVVITIVFLLMALTLGVISKVYGVLDETKVVAEEAEAIHNESIATQVNAARAAALATAMYIERSPAPSAISAARSLLLSIASPFAIRAADGRIVAGANAWSAGGRCQGVRQGVLGRVRGLAGSLQRSRWLHPQA